MPDLKPLEIVETQVVELTTEEIQAACGVAGQGYTLVNAQFLEGVDGPVGRSRFVFNKVT